MCDKYHPLDLYLGLCFNHHWVKSKTGPNFNEFLIILQYSIFSWYTRLISFESTSIAYRAGSNLNVEVARYEIIEKWKAQSVLKVLNYFLIQAKKYIYTHTRVCVCIWLKFCNSHCVFPNIFNRFEIKIYQVPN